MNAFCLMGVSTLNLTLPLFQLINTTNKQDNKTMERKKNKKKQEQTFLFTYLTFDRWMDGWMYVRITNQKNGMHCKSNC